METYDDLQLKDMLKNPATQRKGFEAMVRQYSEQMYWQVRRIVITHEDSNTQSSSHGSRASPSMKPSTSPAGRKTGPP